MIGASKILTVSYGTFSCTLEGFDDPFNTMRAIAEYFRDLAAEDRYFGAEPPTPDAAMLHKIAEREVQRRVEAKIQDNGVILRTGDAMMSSTAEPASQLQPVANAAASTPAMAAMPDGVAAKLLRIRAAVANAEVAESPSEARAFAPADAPAAFAPQPPILADYSEDQHAEDLAATGPGVAIFDDSDFETSSPVADAPSQPLSVIAEALPENLKASDDDYEAPETMPPISVETLAADILDDSDLAVEPSFAAPENDAPEIAVDDSMSDMARGSSEAADTELLAALNLSDTVPPTAVPAESSIAETTEDTNFAPDDLDEEAIAELLALDGAVTADVPEFVIEFADDIASVNESNFEAEAEDTIAAEIVLEVADNLEDDLAEVAVEDSEDLELDSEAEFAFGNAANTHHDDGDADEDLTDTMAPDPVIQEIDSVYEPEEPISAGPSEKALRARARVIKVSRNDPTDAGAVSPLQSAAVAGAMLSDEAEAALRRELRALQADAPAPQSSPAEPNAPPDSRDTETGSQDDARQKLDQAGEAAVSRLLDQTNEVMAVPENRRRLSAIAHLKAAVAATVAERFTKGGGAAAKEAETQRLDPYREDLARVVRPQQTTDSDDAGPAPRPAPLVLVSAQRIDRPRPAPGDTPTQLSAVPNGPSPNASGSITPVRPRRVTSAALAASAPAEVDEEDEEIADTTQFSDARGFAEFSERLGANSLAEILEAAAAYSVCIEGRPFFSRPQLMSQIGALSADSDYSREDGLRTFGALLRDGRIRKVKRGQFVLTETSRYLAEARGLAG